MSQQRINIELSPQDFGQRFHVITQMHDPFARHYFIATDTVTQKRTIYKHYLAETQEQLEAIYDNIENYIKLSQQEGICKILAYTRLTEEQQVLATFQYNDFSLGEYILTPEFALNRPFFYLKLLQQITSIIKSMSEIGIDVDQLNYGNILIALQADNIQIKIFYDQRQKTFDKVLEGVKTFTSLQKLTALVTGNQDYFNELMQLQDGISPQNIYQLGLMLVDMMYKCESNLQMQKDDFLVRDRPVSRSTLIMNDQKSYYNFEDGLIIMNHQYLNDKLTSLRNNPLHVIKELTHLAEMMMAKLDERIRIYELPGEIDRILKIYRDSSKKSIRSKSQDSQKNKSNISVNNEGSNHNSKVLVEGQYNINSNQQTYNNKSIARQVIDKENYQTQFINNNQQPFRTKPQSVHSNSSSTQSQKNTFDEISNTQNNFITNNETHKNQTINEFPSLNPMIKKKNQVYQVDTFALANDQGTNLNSYQQGLKNMQSTYEQQYTSYSSQSYSQNKFDYRQNGTISSKQSLGQKGIVTTNLINQHYTHSSNLTINYPESQSSKKNSSQNKLDISNEKPPRIIIPKQSILMNLKTHQSIKSSLQNLIKEIQNLPDLRKKQYYDNSVYYGGVSPLSNKRTGLGIYLYPSGDIYFGTWLENQLVDGTYIFKNGQTYEGSVKNGKQGWGRYRYSNGNVYEGDWKDDIKEGKGIMWYPNLDKYEGQWVKGKKNGWGKYFYNNGTIYEGNFSNGRKQGFGTITFPNGTKIEANWQQTHIEGEGKVSYPNGDTFQGQYYMSQKHGKGLYVWGSDNTKYQGEFKKDSLEGQARIYFTSKQYYYGRIRNGKRDGQGNYVYQNGDSFIGQWKNDMKLIGNYKFKNGDEFQGKFKDNQLNFGVLRYNNGETFEGEFKNGCRHGVGSYKDRYGELVCEGHWENDNFIQADQ